MHVTVDRVGRIVIPKPMRTALGIGPDSELELTQDGSGLHLEPVRRHERTIGIEDGLPILGPVQGAMLTDGDVQRMRDELHR